MSPHKMDWLRFEQRIRDVLRAFGSDNFTAETALLTIDGILGDETGRGWELTDVCPACRDGFPLELDRAPCCGRRRWSHRYRVWLGSAEPVTNPEQRNDFEFIRGLLHRPVSWNADGFGFAETIVIVFADTPTEAGERARAQVGERDYWRVLRIDDVTEGNLVLGECLHCGAMMGRGHARACPKWNPATADYPA